MPVIISGAGGSGGKLINGLVAYEEYIRGLSSLIYCGVITNDLFYMADSKYLHKHSLSTLERNETPIQMFVNGSMGCMTTDGIDIIAGSRSDNNYTFAMMNIANETVSESASYGAYIQALATDGNEIFAGGVTVNAIKKCSKSDITTWTATGADYGAIILAIALDGDYIYYAGGTGTIIKALKSDLTVQATSPNYDGDIVSICISGDYVYAVGSTTKKIFKYNKSDLTKVAESDVIGSYSLNVIKALTDTLLVGNYTDGYIYQYNQSDLTFIKKSAKQGTTINDIVVSDDQKYFINILGGRYDYNLIRKFYINPMYK